MSAGSRKEKEPPVTCLSKFLFLFDCLVKVNFRVVGIGKKRKPVIRFSSILSQVVLRELLSWNRSESKWFG